MSTTTLLSQTPEWADVTPIPQPEGENPLVKIAYRDAFADVMGLFRAIFHAEELSERALKLTEAVIDENPGNYAAWNYRRRCMQALGKDPRAEIDGFVTQFLEDTPKNYQVWCHRQCLIDELGDATGELDKVAEIIALDTKNYHAWNYRQHVVRKFGLWPAELAYCNDCHVDDVRNNSAWNQRLFVLTHLAESGLFRRVSAAGAVLPEADVEAEDVSFAQSNLFADEVACALKFTRLASNNESPWSYVRGLVALANVRLCDVPAIAEQCGKFQAGYNKDVAAVLTMLFDLALSAMDKYGGTAVSLWDKPTLPREQDEEAFAAAKSDAMALLTKLKAKDAVRIAYWAQCEAEVVAAAFTAA